MKQTELLKEKIAVLEELVYNLTYRGERKERLALRSKLVSLTDQVSKVESSEPQRRMSAEEVMIKHCTDNGLLNLNMGKQIIAAMIEFASQQSASDR